MGIQTLLKYCTYYSGMSAALSLARGNQQVWILDYHSVSDASGQNFQYVAPNLAVAPGVFERHVAFLSKRYQIISLDDVVNWISGTAEIQGPAVVITFDDGYRDNYLYAYPVLKKWAATATFYVVTEAIGEVHPLWTCEIRDLVYRSRENCITLSCAGAELVDLSNATAKVQTIQTIGRLLRRADKKAREEILREMRQKLVGNQESRRPPVMMNWDELREMKRGGMCIGSHTVSHPLLTGIAHKDAAVEISASKAKIEEELGAPVTHFAYPNPGGSVHVNEEVKRLVRNAGYFSARKVFKSNVSRDSDPFELNGINVGRSCNHPALLSWILN